ncbi:Gfo/Idh/MocA family oxidoreductase [Nocardia sp. NPDC047038]|uniref:Gfo/Idh/MocA family protein n=1 Tax=Nocardia sp. NPDC047038 TaxID=3154338 RepID=UPI0033EAA931
MSADLGVAVVGIGADQWSGAAHLPALAATEGVRLARLVTSSPESAARAEEAYGVPASASLEDALADPAVQLVTVTVRVSRHRKIAETAIRAGKHLYCEWPLGADLAETQALADLSAQHPEQIHVVGLQGRLAPEICSASSAIAAGRLGRPLRANLQVFLPQGLVPRPRHRAHLRHRSAAADVLSIQGGHSLDMMVALLGEPGPVHHAVLWAAVGYFTVLETGERLARDAPDNLVAQLEIGGIPVTVQLSQTSTRSGSSIEILGTRASLLVTAQDQPQFSALRAVITDLDGTSQELQPLDDVAGVELPRDHAGFNVAIAYRNILDAIAGRVPHDAVPTLARAVTLHQLLDSIEKLAERAATPSARSSAPDSAVLAL